MVRSTLAVSLLYTRPHRRRTNPNAVHTANTLLPISKHCAQVMAQALERGSKTQHRGEVIMAQALDISDLYVYILFATLHGL